MEVPFNHLGYLPWVKFFSSTNWPKHHFKPPLRVVIFQKAACSACHTSIMHFVKRFLYLSVLCLPVCNAIGLLSPHPHKGTFLHLKRTQNQRLYDTALHFKEMQHKIPDSSSLEKEQATWGKTDPEDCRWTGCQKHQLRRKAAIMCLVGLVAEASVQLLR